jgi:small subunit ribosomal protein S20
VASSKIPLRFNINSEEVLANIKSAIKRNRQNEKRRVQNLEFRSSARGFVKKANVAIQSGDVEKARAAYRAAASALDKAAVKGVIHKNNAARRKGAIMSKLAALEKTKK